MESKRLLTRKMIEEYGVTDIQPDYFVRENRHLQKGLEKYLITEPTIAKCKNRLGELQYLSLCVALWDPVKKKYINTQYHKMVYAWHYGEVPVGYEVDHINTNPFDNRIENLRLTTRAENFANKKKWKMFTFEEIKDKSIPEIRQMIFDRIEEYKDNPYKKKYISFQHSEEYFQNKLNKLYNMMEQIKQDTKHSEHIKQKRLKMLKEIEENVKKNGKYGKGYHLLRKLKENAKDF